MAEEKLGAAGNDTSLFTGPALSAFNTLAGGEDRAQQALALANALSPKLQEFDPYIAAMKYFTGMTEAASKPGATVFGAAAQAFKNPVDYLQEVNQINRKIKASVPQTAISIAQALKPPKTAAGSLKSDFYGVQRKKDDGTLTDVVETPLTPAELQALKADPKVIITRVEPSSTKTDNVRMDVILKDVVDNPETVINERITSIPRGDFDSTKHIPASALPKDSSQSDDRTRMNVILKSATDNPATAIDERITSILRKDYDSTKHIPTEALSPTKAPPSVEERRSKTVFDFVDLFVATPNEVSPRNYATFLDAVKSMSKVKIISFEDENGNTQTISSPGKDAYKLIAEAYGPEVATAIRKLSKASGAVDTGAVDNNQIVENVSPKLAAGDVLSIKLSGGVDLDNNFKVTRDGKLIIPSLPPIDVADLTASEAERKILELLKLGDPTSTVSVMMGTGAVETVVVDDKDKDEPKDVTETFKIGNQTFTLLSSTAKKIPKEAVQGLVDSTAGMVDVKIAFDIIFKGGKLNRKTVAAANLIPGGGVGPEGSITGDARTAYQAMKRSIELLLRARSGAAVPPAEVENYMTLYFPATLDNEAQARGKLARLAQYFADTNRLLSLGNASGSDTFSGDITPQSNASQTGGDEEGVVTITSEWTLDGVKYKQLSNGQIISEEAD